MAKKAVTSLHLPSRIIQIVLTSPMNSPTLGKWQTDALKKQGADPGFGARLAESFFQAGIQIIEAGTIQSVENEASHEEWELEWAVIEIRSGRTRSRGRHPKNETAGQSRARNAVNASCTCPPILHGVTHKDFGAVIYCSHAARKKAEICYILVFPDSAVRVH
ncbi:MAG: hypothetical protein M0C28_36545 [Candidatus Moduliflexus flocculans]|nr:hypothetical protein [Candidatus Moduliflexus flocculans]